MRRAMEDASVCSDCSPQGERESVADGENGLSYVRYFARRAVGEPFHVIPAVIALLNGLWHRLKFLALGKRVKVGPWLRVYGKLRIIGPGRVYIGRNCIVHGKVLRPVTLQTWSRDAEIRLGNDIGMNGTVIQCYEQVVVEDMAHMADAYITDSAAHVLSADRRQHGIDRVPSSPVRVGRNVWISVSTVVLKGVFIGDNSVVAACSLVRSPVPENVLVAGQPAKIVRTVPATLDELVSGL